MPLGQSEKRVRIILQSSEWRDCAVRTSSSTVFSELTPCFVSYAQLEAMEGSSAGSRAYLGNVTGIYVRSDERRETLDEWFDRSEREFY